MFIAAGKWRDEVEQYALSSDQQGFTESLVPHFFYPAFPVTAIDATGAGGECKCVSTMNCSWTSSLSVL